MLLPWTPKRHSHLFSLLSLSCGSGIRGAAAIEIYLPAPQSRCIGVDSNKVNERISTRSGIGARVLAMRQLFHQPEDGREERLDGCWGAIW